MNLALEMLNNFRYTSKIYERSFSEIRKKYDMTQLEVDILAFLKNNPHMDTASDIVRYRMLPKANVSQGVELLIQKEMLVRRTDPCDRRRVHLELQKEAEPVLEGILEAQRSFGEILFRGIPEDEREWYLEMSHRISENIQDGLENGKNGK
ncbi:MAG: MarR family transcriptional regulator [Clostridiales bacterium]|nr:MarR family transcriptional regulator [Clostridiales bacterium]